MIDISLKNADGVALYAMPKKNKDGSFADFWITSMENPAGIYEIVKSKYSAKR